MTPAGHATFALEKPNDVLAAALRELTAQQQYPAAVALIDSLRPADGAEVLERLDASSSQRILLQLQTSTAADVLGAMTNERRVELASIIEPAMLARIIDDMPPDAATDFVRGMDAQLRRVIIQAISPESAREITALLRHDDQTAGGLMSTDFLSVGEEATLDEVVGLLRAKGREVEMANYIYVLGGSGQLKGVLSLRQLVTADRGASVRDVMTPDVVSVPPDMDREEVAEVVRRHDFVAVPVVDEIGRMLGVITVDDVLKAMAEEAEEHVFRFAGSFEEEDEPTYSPIRLALRQRLPWLALATVVELGAAYLLLGPLPRELMILSVAYIPLLLFVGGNAAIQAAARVLVRLEGTRTETASAWSHAGREMFSGLVLSVLGSGVSVPLLVVLGAQPQFAGVVGVALAATVVLGAGVGGFLPVIFQRLRLDPGVVSGPLLGSVMDVLGLSIFLSLANVFWRLAR